MLKWLLRCVATPGAHGLRTLLQLWAMLPGSGDKGGVFQGPFIDYNRFLPFLNITVHS